MPKLQAPVPYSESRRWSTAEGRAMMAAFEDSGLSLADFARRQGVHVERLRRWRRRLERERSSPLPDFVEIVGATTTPSPVEIVLRSGRVLRVAETIAPTTLRSLVEVLEEETSC